MKICHSVPKLRDSSESHQAGFQIILESETSSD